MLRGWIFEQSSKKITSIDSLANVKEKNIFGCDEENAIEMCIKRGYRQYEVDGPRAVRIFCLGCYRVQLP